MPVPPRFSYCEKHGKERQRAASRRWKQQASDDYRERERARLRMHYAENVERERQRHRDQHAAHREERRAAAKFYYKYNKEEHLQRVAEWRAAHPDKAARYRQAYLNRINADPVKRQEYLENAQISARVRRERKGGSLRLVSIESYRAANPENRGRVPAAPLVPFLMKLKRENHGDLPGLDDVLVRRAYGILEQKQERISLAVADRMCVALGLSFALLYPMEDAA